MPKDVWPTWPPTQTPVTEPTRPPYTTESTTPRPKCQVPGWHVIKGREIYLSEVYSDVKSLSWFEADSKAEAIGGYLAEITSEEESEVFNEIKECKMNKNILYLNSSLKIYIIYTIN